MEEKIVQKRSDCDEIVTFVCVVVVVAVAVVVVVLLLLSLLLLLLLLLLCLSSDKYDPHDLQRGPLLNTQEVHHFQSEISSFRGDLYLP